MSITNIKIQGCGYVHCSSNFYSVHDVLQDTKQYVLEPGINRMVGEIDSGVWSVSYLISMYEHEKNSFILQEQPTVFVNDKPSSIIDVSSFSCYMDKRYPLFSTRKSLEVEVEKGIKRNNIKYTANDIRNLFCIDSERFKRSLSGMGNEVFKAMAALGYCYNKEVFCFPWLSNTRFIGYHRHLTGLLDVLQKLNKIVVLPIGRE